MFRATFIAASCRACDATGACRFLHPVYTWRDFVSCIFYGRHKLLSSQVVRCIKYMQPTTSSIIFYVCLTLKGSLRWRRFNPLRQFIPWCFYSRNGGLDLTWHCSRMIYCVASASTLVRDCAIYSRSSGFSFTFPRHFRNLFLLYG